MGGEYTSLRGPVFTRAFFPFPDFFICACQFYWKLSLVYRCVYVRTCASVHVYNAYMGVTMDFPQNMVDWYVAIRQARITCGFVNDREEVR